MSFKVAQTVNRAPPQIVWISQVSPSTRGSQDVPPELPCLHIFKSINEIHKKFTTGGGFKGGGRELLGEGRQTIADEKSPKKKFSKIRPKKVCKKNPPPSATCKSFWEAQAYSTKFCIFMHMGSN